ncbi:GntR family transcriptional regulator [Actinomadura logoneensis]|uniref:GntR family transcriptional regulator n=1 Tax=Actinomadura logoneensis TaxID=2293572 RepID=A0A372JIJ0_9ACTN|nr:GntR family transcriptional regulator [Actinomadura logoneensis]
MHDAKTADASPQGLPSVRARVTEALRAWIVTGELEPGQVYSAPRLGAQLGVSPTPVREAMLDLVKEGLVRTARNKGFEVLAPSPAALHDILEMRLLLEVPTVRRLAERGVREADLAALLPLAEETVRAAEKLDVVRHVAADLKFHLALLGLWGNDEITETVRALRSRSRLAGLWSAENHDAMIESAHEHLALLDLLRRRDDAATAELMEHHITRVSAFWSKWSSAG